MAKDPKAEVEITAHSKGLNAKLREARAKIQNQFGASAMSSIFGKAAGGSKATKASVLGNMFGNMAAQGAYAAGGFLSDQGKQVLDYNERIERLRILSGSTREEMDTFSRSVRAASDETGLGKDAVLESARAFVTLTGDMETAKGKALEWAMVAQATESTAADIASTAAAMRQNLNIDTGDMLDAFGILNEQGKKGAIELKDLAQELANLAPQWAIFKGGTGLQGLKEMGAALQIAKRGFGGEASETVTGVQGMLTALIKNSKRFTKAKVRIFDTDKKTGVKTMRNVFDIIDDIGKSKLVKDPAKLEKAFGRVEAYRAYLQLSKNNEELKAMAKNSGSAADITRDFKDFMSTDSGKQKADWQDITNKIKEAFTPERLNTFITALTSIAATLGVVVGAIGTILSATEAAGRGLARLIGGASQEDKIKETQAKRLDERERYLSEQYTKKHGLNAREKRELYVNDRDPNSRMWWSDERRKFVSSSMGQEESLKGMLRKQVGGGTITRPKYDSDGKIVGSTGNYSIPELRALRGISMRGGDSDTGMTSALINEAIAKLSATFATDFASAMRGEGFPYAAPPQTILQLGQDTVAKAAANAPRTRGRPGG